MWTKLHVWPPKLIPSVALNIAKNVVRDPQVPISMRKYKIKGAEEDQILPSTLIIVRDTPVQHPLPRHITSDNDLALALGVRLRVHPHPRLPFHLGFTTELKHQQHPQQTQNETHTNTISAQITQRGRDRGSYSLASAQRERLGERRCKVLVSASHRSLRGPGSGHDAAAEPHAPVLRRTAPPAGPRPRSGHLQEGAPEQPRPSRRCRARDRTNAPAPHRHG